MVAKDAASHVEPVDEVTFTACMEQLQEGYVYSVAATAGCLINPVPRDYYGVDLEIIRQRGPHVEEQMIKVQLKNTTTIKPDVSRDHFSFQFKARKHLEHLAKPRGIVKAILIVMVTDPHQSAWTTGDHDALLTSHCCYWENYEGHPVNPTVAKPTVHVPTANRFDAPALLRMFDRLDTAGEL